MADRRPTIMATAVGAVGPIKGARVVAFMVQWYTAREALGDDWPSDGVEVQIAAYADWWRVTERTGWNELRRFRAVWPTEQTPTRLMDLAAATWEPSRGVRGLGAVAIG